MSLSCALSNEVPETPVVSTASGSIFEKRLILKYLKEHGTDPINGQVLTEDMLVDIKVPPIVKPKPPSATSIPSLLKSLQDEWDAIVLHAFTLRKQLQASRQDLSHALYQHDAACRVIARLTKEVTAAREALATLKPKIADTTQLMKDFTEQKIEEAGITPEIVSKLEETAQHLTADRKQRAKSVPNWLVDSDTMRTLRTVASHTGIHSASMPGIVAIDICPSDGNRIMTGGKDKNAVIFDKERGEIVTTLKGHNKEVSSLVYHPNQTCVITGSPDTNIRVWNVEKSNTTHLIEAHNGAITGLSLHATGDYLLSTSRDRFWAFSDIATGVVLAKVGDDSGAELTTGSFHPDGLIFGTGTSNSVMKIWDLKEQTNVANFPGHFGEVVAMDFSENGYYLATAGEDATVKLWDLRKLKNFKTLLLEEEYVVRALKFDESGTYLAVAGTDVRVYSKSWDCLRILKDHLGLAMGVEWGSKTEYLASVGKDRSLKFYEF